jgi:glycosyltransferase involved in cell wall biosynthesis
MGQQVYERELALRAPGVLGPDWQVETFPVTSLRSTHPARARVPARLFGDVTPLLRRSVGRAVYRGFDLVHRLDLRLPPAPRPEVLTIHDVVCWRFPDEGRPPADAAESARRSEVVICPSQFSADEVAATLGVTRLAAIPQGVHPAFREAQPLDGAALAGLGVRPPFVLHAGGCTQRKNLEGLADAWSVLAPTRPEVTLVLIGPEDDRRSRRFDPLPGTVRLGRVDDATAVGLMASASALVVPSLYEGFGLPALEGMAVGVPVVAARRSSLPEVCGDGALLVEPDGDSLAQGIEAALDGGPEIEAMRRRGLERSSAFTWEATAEAHAQLWRGALA